jgi:AcrR family transcriptional regulator
MALRDDTQARRLNREESKRRTHERLLSAARDVFLQRGFHAASVAEIAERAGYTTGAIYSNFGGKDDLFLAMLDIELAERAVAQRDVLETASFEEMARAAARWMYRAGVQEPAMTPLIVEFWTYAADKPDLRERARALQERQMQWIADIIRDGCRRHGVRLRLPFDQVARGGGALSRGVRLEWLVDPEAVGEQDFEEMLVAYLTGLALSAGSDPTDTRGAG